MKLTSGWVFRVIRSDLKFNLAVVFLSKNPRKILSKNSAYQSWSSAGCLYLKTNLGFAFSTYKSTEYLSQLKLLAIIGEETNLL